MTKIVTFPTTVLVSCAGDDELAKRLYDFLLSRIGSESNPANFISYNADEVELRNEEAKIEKESIRSALRDFVDSDDALRGHSITEFGDVFAVGIMQSLDTMVLSCEMCGYIAAHEDELSIHRTTHGPL